jgi:hypothetical protein
MRVPIKGDDYFCRHLNAVAENMQQSFLDSIKSSIEMYEANAMLGDGTVTQAQTFDPQKVQNFFQRLGNALEGWTFSGILNSATEDIHRTYATFTKEADQFYISIYFGIQFHVLLYYKVDRRVIDTQRELAEIENRASFVLKNLTGAADKVLATEFEKRGYTNLGFEDLFARMFEDERFVEELTKKTSILEDQFPDFKETGAKKNELLSKLNDLLIKFYRTSPVLIDYNKLMQGEEGVTNYFDIEIVKNKKTRKREAFLDTSRLPKGSAQMLSQDLGAVEETLRRIAG